MRRFHSRARTPLKVLALVFAAGLARNAEAAPISVVYRSYGAVGTEGVTSSTGSVLPAVSFDSLATDTTAAPGLGNHYVQLGSFVVDPLPAGQTTTYDKTPFSITLDPVALDGAATTSLTTVQINGTLNGSVSGSTGNLIATYNPPLYTTFASSGDVLGTLVSPGGPATITQSLAVGTNAVTGVINLTQPPPSGQLPVPAPEPASIALFLVGGVGVALRQRLRRPRG